MEQGKIYNQISFKFLFEWRHRKSLKDEIQTAYTKGRNKPKQMDLFKDQPETKSSIQTEYENWKSNRSENNNGWTTYGYILLAYEHYYHNPLFIILRRRLFLLESLKGLPLRHGGRQAATMSFFI